MEVKLNKKLHRYLVQNSLVLEIKAVKDTASGVRTHPCGNNRRTFLTPNHYSLTDADLTSSDMEVTKELKRMKHIPVVVSYLSEALAHKSCRKTLKKFGHAFLHGFSGKVQVTLTPVERVI